MASSVIYHYRIVEMAQQILGNLDSSILEYYRSKWPTEIADFTPVTTYDNPSNQPCNIHPAPLEMITKSYSIMKTHFPDKEDWDILTSIILYFYSTVVLEYYALEDAEQQDVFLQRKFVSPNFFILVTQDDQIFQVVENTTVKRKYIELRKVSVTNPAIRDSLRFQTMTLAERTATLRLFESNEIEYVLKEPKYFIHPKDPLGHILRPKDSLCATFEMYPITMDGFFHKYQNKETQSLLFHMTTRDEPWASELRRMFQGLPIQPKTL